MKIKSLFFSVLLLLSKVFAQTPTINGPSVVTTSSEGLSYTVDWGQAMSLVSIANVTWSVSNGTIISSDKTSCIVVWDQIPTSQNGTGRLEVTEDIGANTGILDVIIENFRTTQSTPCIGVIGQSIVFETFGSAGSGTPSPIGPPLPAGITTYEYKNYCQISSNQYTLTSTSFGCNGNWLAIQDHTPFDINGYFMLVDADNRPDQVYNTNFIFKIVQFF